MADARIASTFRTHPKRVKLQRKLGAAGVLAFVDLILFASEARTSGVMVGMTTDDIAIAAQWNGDAEEFAAALIDLRFLDRSEHGEYVLHDWCEHNPFVANSDDRRMHAKVNAHVGWLKRKGTVCQVKRCALCRAYALRMRASKFRNAPTPSHHSPLTTPTNKESKSKTSRPARRSARTFNDDSREIKAARYLFQKIQANNPTAKEPNWQAWAQAFDLIFRIDKREPDEVRKRIDQSQVDPFWLKNILSPAALRKQYDRLSLATKSATPTFDRTRPVV